MPNRKASRKSSRKANRKANRKGRRGTRKNRRQNGGANESLAQGVDFMKNIPGAARNMSGGAYTPLGGAPVTAGDQGMLDSGLRAMARVTPLDASINAASTMRDPDQMPAQKGGRRRRGSRKTRKNRKANSRKNRKASRKNRKSSRKNRKTNSRKSRKSRRSNRKNRKANSRKNRKTNRRNNNRRNRRQSGGHMLYEGAPIGGSTMLLDPDMQAKAGTADFKVNSGLMGMKGN